MSKPLTARASFWVAAVVAGLVLWGSAAPSVSYPLYARAWDLTPTVTTAIFAIYPVALIPVLLIFGNLSDVIGRRAAILLGLAALAAGALALGLAPNLGWVLVGRAMTGVGVGLALSPATAAMIEFGALANPSDPNAAARASSTTTAATATGLALATLVGGALVQYAPAPMHLNFWVLLVVVLATGVAVWFLPRHTRAETVGPWRPRTLHVPRGIRAPFIGGTLGIAAAFASGAIFLALGAQIARDLLDSANALLDGAVISVSAVVIGLVAVLARRVDPPKAMAAGTATGVVGFALIVGAGLASSLWLFLASAVVSGIAYSLLFAGGLGLVSANAPAHHRGAILSAAYSVGYLVQAAAALGLGAIATTGGLQRALEIGSPIIVAIGVAATLIGWSGRTRAETTGTPQPSGTATGSR
ncbi:MAG TPA: MFS transporter [Propionibacteriaceae bacterium]